MAFRIIWTGSAREDLKAVVKYIKSDNPKLVYRLGCPPFGEQLIPEFEKIFKTVTDMKIRGN